VIPTKPRSDPERFEALYREHHLAVLRFARRRTDPASAEEIVAETFAVAWRRLDRVPPEPLPWLLIVARKTLANRHRSAARASDKIHRATAAGATAVPDPAEALAERDALMRAFMALGDRDREALRLVAWDGLSLADAARVAGTTRIAFASRVHRARRRLAAALDEQSDPGHRFTRPRLESSS
jgi:RNA polymerase sigma-70 factor (ECF subfamily)